MERALRAFGKASAAHCTNPSAGKKILSYKLSTGAHHARPTTHYLARYHGTHQVEASGTSARRHAAHFASRPQDRVARRSRRAAAVSSKGHDRKDRSLSRYTDLRPAAHPWSGHASHGADHDRAAPHSAGSTRTSDPPQDRTNDIDGLECDLRIKGAEAYVSDKVCNVGAMDQTAPADDDVATVHTI